MAQKGSMTSVVLATFALPVEGCVRLTPATRNRQRTPGGLCERPVVFYCQDRFRLRLEPQQAARTTGPSCEPLAVVRKKDGPQVRNSAAWHTDHDPGLGQGYDLVTS